MQTDFDPLAACRICLQVAEDDECMVSIFSRDKDSTHMIYEKIENCAGIKIINYPELPTRICTKCRAFLTVADKFRLICKNSDSYLRQFVCKTHDDDYEDGIPEYLNEFASETTNGLHLSAQPTQQSPTQQEQEQQLLQAITQIHNNDAADLEMVDYNELWPCEEEEEENHGGDDEAEAEPEDNDAEDEIIEEDLSSQENSISPAKTLEISPDGAAVIRVRANRADTVKPKQLHVCDICGNTYPRKYALEAHMRRHRNERPFECEICHQTFHLNFQLTRHIRKHIGLRPYICQYCSRAFGDRSTMVKHERIHRNERPYSCYTCGKSFTYSSVLKVHMLTHTGEKPFHCGICGKRFARSHHLRAHLDTQLHHNDPRSKILLRQIKRQEDNEADDTAQNPYPIA